MWPVDMLRRLRRLELAHVEFKLPRDGCIHVEAAQAVYIALKIALFLKPVGDVFVERHQDLLSGRIGRAVELR